MVRIMQWGEICCEIRTVELSLRCAVEGRIAAGTERAFGVVTWSSGVS